MPPIIFDVGSYSLRVGFSGEYAPRFDIPLISGSIRQNIDFMTKKRIFDQLGMRRFKEEYFFGHEALYLRNYLDIQWLYDGRNILDEFFMDKIVEYTTELLKKPLTNESVLISQPFHSNVVTQLGTKLLANLSAYDIIPVFQPLLNLLAYGVRTGLVVDIGHSLTQITPVVNGQILVDGVQVVDQGGKDITTILQGLLLESGALEGLQESAILSTEAVAEMIKEVYCYVSRNPADELEDPRKRGSTVKFPLLHGEEIKVGVERFLAPETLFAPQKSNVPPLNELIAGTISNYEGGIQQALLGNILLTGGTSLFPGLSERLNEELVRYYIDFNYSVNILPFAQFGSPRYSGFFGAAKLATIEFPKSMKVTKVEYEHTGALNIPIALLEEFNTVFDQTKGAQLKPIIISVKNLHNSRLYQELYNIINSQRETLINELGDRLQRSPLEIYQMIESLVSYEIIQGEFAGYKFINLQFREEGKAPAVAVQAAQSQPQPESQSQVSQQPIEEDYVPSFARLDTQMPDQMQVKAPKRGPEGEGYKPSFERLDSQMPDQTEVSSRRPVAQEEPYVPSFEVLDSQMPDQMESKSRRPAVGEEGYVPSFESLDEKMPDQVEVASRRSAVHEGADKPSFERLDAQMPDQMDVPPAQYARVKEAGLTDEEADYEYTYQKIDDQKKDEWAEDDTIISGKARTGRRTQVLEERGPAFARVDREKAADWEKEGIVSTPKQVKPRGFFDEVALPAEPGDEKATFAKVDQEKAKDWAADETVITEKPPSARAKLKALLGEGPSYEKAEQEKQAEWDESGLILMPKKPKPKGFFAQPTLPAQEDVELPTFLRIKDQEIPQPKKVMIADLLKPKEELIGTVVPQASRAPTYLAGQELTEEQLRQIREVEEEERKRKEKEEKLL